MTRCHITRVFVLLTINCNVILKPDDFFYYVLIGKTKELTEDVFAFTITVYNLIDITIGLKL